MADMPPEYAGKVADVMSKANNGTLMSSNQNLQYLQGKANVPAVAEFLASIAGKIK